jgi:type II secretory pathway component GspD/PulD (secretin)
MKRVYLLLLGLFLLSGEAAVTQARTLTFENADIQQVIKRVGEFTGTTFLFDPEQVKGKITLLTAKEVSPDEALRLLQSALALRGYTMVVKEEGTWIVPVEQVALKETRIEVVPLHYAKAEEVAYALSWVAPYGVRVVPYLPTNSLILSGDPEAIEALLRILRGKDERVTE